MKQNFKTSNILKQYRGIPTIYCPGCKKIHTFDERWKYNGNCDSPTFSPSMLVYQHCYDLRCHSFVREGNIQFLNDCHHELAGKTVKIPDMPGDLIMDDMEFVDGVARKREDYEAT